MNEKSIRILQIKRFTKAFVHFYLFVVLLSRQSIWKIYIVFYIVTNKILFYFQDKLQLVSVLGAGLLVGTALAVIIPEGVRVLFTTSTNSELRGSHGKIWYEI